MAFCLGAEAANRYEQENNDSYESADRFYAGERLYGTVSSYDDKDYFKFVAPSNGVLNLTFNHRYVSNYSSWNNSCISINFHIKYGFLPGSRSSKSI